MKRLFSILLLGTFLFSTIGVVASSMTCNMKEMKSKSCCSRNNADFCQKEVKLLKLKDDFVSQQNQKIVKPLQFFFADSDPQLILYRCYVPYNPIATDEHAPPLSALGELSFLQTFLI